MGILIKGDRQDAVNLINKDDKEDNHPCRILIEECRKLRWEVKPNIQHVLRKTNRCINKMARLKRIQNEKLVKILVLPIVLVDELMADLEGNAFPKGF